MGERSFAVAFLLAASAFGCAWYSSTAALERDNPVRPLAPPPFGMEEFFREAKQPVPARVRLGRWLFFDTRLSGDGTVSCATCHRPEHAFSEPTQVSTGVGGQRGTRKSPSLINLAARTILPDIPEDHDQKFFWDGRAPSLEAQVLVPISNPSEMGLEHQAMIDRLSAVEGYAPYFREAFGSGAITRDRIALALSDYVRTRVSGNSAYDRWAFGNDAGALTEQQKRGAEIFFFKGRCATCHAGFNFSDGRFYTLGIGWDPVTRTFKDEGRGAISQRPEDRGAFKVPGLRDVSKHAPYMHDGSLPSLEAVVEFYNRGANLAGLPPGRVVPLNLDSADMAALVSFLEALDGEGYADQAPKHFPR